MVGNAEQGVAKAHDHPTTRRQSPIERAVRTHLGRKIHHCTFRDSVCRSHVWSGSCVEIRQSCKCSFFFHAVNTWSGVKRHFRNRIILGRRHVNIAKIGVELHRRWTCKWGRGGENHSKKARYRFRKGNRVYLSTVVGNRGKLAVRLAVIPYLQITSRGTP